MFERLRQDYKFGERDQHSMMWAVILGEEIGEVNKEICESDFQWTPSENYRKELIEVAAVALAAIQNYDYSKKYERKSTSVDMMKFTEWCGDNYFKIYGAWCHRYADQRDEKNHYTTEQLLALYIEKNGKEKE